jgi:predicted permease
MNLEIFIYIILATGILLFSYNLWLIIKSNSTGKWHETKGVILKSQLSDYSSIEVNDYKFLPEIEYSYKISDKEFKSKKIYFGGNLMTSYNKKISRKTVEKYSKDSEVTVFYNTSNNNKESVLEKGIHYQPIIGFILGLLLAGLGILLLRNPGLFVLS